MRTIELMTPFNYIDLPMRIVKVNNVNIFNCISIFVQGHIVKRLIALHLHLHELSS